MKDPTMDITTPPTDRYRIVFTEIRTHELTISSDKPHNLEAWARDGWNAGAPGEGLTLIASTLTEVSVHPADDLPWKVAP